MFVFITGADRRNKYMIGNLKMDLAAGTLGITSWTEAHLERRGLHWVSHLANVI
jgi:hypothetical protein